MYKRQNVFDGNFATTYKPSAANGSFTYRISEPDQRTIRIIQNGKASNADVQAVLYKDGAKQEAAAIGKLNQTINEFAVGKDSQILEVIVTWAEDIPEISIIKTSEKEKAAVNKDALNEAIKKPIDDKWTADSKRAAEEAKAAGATGLFENKYGEKVKVYTIGDFSKEICGGPHVSHTGELGHFKIKKEESSSAGVRRIKAILE